MAGIHSEKELTDALAYETASDQEKDYASALAGFPKISWSGHCMYCGHCAPCPVGIDVAMVTKLLNLAQAQKEIPETVSQHYRALKVSAGNCIGCGSCTSRCPFEVDAAANMATAAALFEK
jgi:predicted aldo/keto reductase-like oxidoreductase